MLNIVFIDLKRVCCWQVQEVVKMMEMELGDGWIYHQLCKVPFSCNYKKLTVIENKLHCSKLFTNQYQISTVQLSTYIFYNLSCKLLELNEAS